MSNPQISDPYVPSLPDSKPVWQSKTVLSMVAMIVVHILARRGIAGDWVQGAVDSSLGDAATIIVPALIAIYGRWTAKHTLIPPAIPPLVSTQTPKLAFVAVLLAGVLTISPGCAATDPITRADKAVLGLEISEEALGTAVDLGAISAKRKAEVVPYVKAAHAAKESMVASALADNKTAFTAAVDALQAAVTALADAEAKAKTATAADSISPATTQP